MPATIVLRPHPKRADTAIAVIQGGKLEGPAWGRYSAIGPFDRENTARSFKRAELPAVVGKLAGLAFTVDPTLADGAEKARGAVLARVEGADARVTEAEARSGRTLYPYQRDGARWLASRPAALLADEMGTGKTAQSLIAASSRVVVVCPASLRQNWIREARIWRPDLRGTTIDGVGAFRWPAEGEMVVIGYEGLPASTEELAVMPGSKVYVLKVGPVGRAFHARLFVVERGEISEITALAVRAGVSGKLKGPKAADYAAVVTLARSWSKQDCQIAAEALASVLGYTPEAFVGEAL